MKFSTIAFSLASMSLAQAQQVIFFAHNSELSISGPLQTVKASNGASVLYINEEGSGSQFDLKYNSALSIEGQFGHAGSIGSGSFLAAGEQVSADKLEFVGNTLVTNQYWACPATEAHINISSSAYFIAVTEDSVAPAEGCVAVEIEKKVAESSQSVTGKFGVWTNATFDVTVVDYVTFCPHATTLTVTTCEEFKCAPHTVAVEEDTTITITGTVVVQSAAATPTPASDEDITPESAPKEKTVDAQSTTAPKASTKPNSETKNATADVKPSATSSPSSAGKQAPAGVIASVNGVERNVANFAGLLAFAALLI